MTWRERWGQILRELEVRNVVLTTDDEATLFAMDAHVRDVEAKLCRAMDELSNIANAKRYGLKSNFADDTEFAAWAQNRTRHTLSTLSSTAPCHHEGENKRLWSLIDMMLPFLPGSEAAFVVKDCVGIERRRAKGE